MSIRRSYRKYIKCLGKTVTEILQEKNVQCQVMVLICHTIMAVFIFNNYLR